MSAKHILSATCIVALVAVVWVGCADEAPQLAVTQGCSLSSECKSPLVCAFAKCHQACKSSRDCSNGERCVQSDRPYYVCQKQGCSRNSECLGKQVCAPDGQCHDQCLTQKDCLADQVCTAGACADTTELVNGSLPNVTGDAGAGTRCTLPTDCPGDLVCLRGGVCGAECIGDKDCLKTYVCKPLRPGGAGRCFPGEEVEVDAGFDSGTVDAAGDANDGGSTTTLASQGRLGVSFFHSCAILARGKMKCWGLGVAGGLGSGDTQARGDQAGEMGSNLPFVDLGTGLTATFVVTGQKASCVIVSDGRVKCFGEAASGQIGSGDTQNRGDGPNEMGDNLPFVDLGTGRTAKFLSMQMTTVCAILDNDKVKCWGENGSGQLGIGDTQSRGDGPNEMGDNLPYADLGTGRTVKYIAAGTTHTCAILDNDKVKCWGYGGAGGLGYGDGQNRVTTGQLGDNLPYVDLGTGRTAVSIGVGNNRTCVLLDNATIKCWGYGGTYGLGYGDLVSRGDGPNEMGDNLPSIDLGQGRTAKSMRALGDTICAILDNDKVKCWGRNDNGELGIGDSSPRGNAGNHMGDNLPYVDLGPGRTARAVFTSNLISCAVLDNDGVKCWGRNDAGQLGIGDNTARGNMPNQMGANLPYVDLGP